MNMIAIRYPGRTSQEKDSNVMNPSQIADSFCAGSAIVSLVDVGVVKHGAAFSTLA
jgi:hypothetical protein